VFKKLKTFIGFELQTQTCWLLQGLGYKHSIALWFHWIYGTYIWFTPE